MNDRRGFPPMMQLDVLSMELFRTVHVMGRTFQEVAASYGMSRTQGMILGSLMRNPEGLTASMLRRHMGFAAATLSTALADMERDGLIKRVPNPHDARSQLILLAEAGQARLEAFPEVARQIDERVFAGFSDDDRSKFKEFMERIRMNLGDEGSQDFIGEAGFGEESSKEKADIG